LTHQDQREDNRTLEAYPLRYEWSNPDIEEGEVCKESVEFRLVYQGPLPSSGNRSTSSRVAQKHGIRKAFHPQLAQLWSTHPGLKSLGPFAQETRSGATLSDYARLHLFDQSPERLHMLEQSPERPSILEELSRRFAVCGFNFVPLINTSLALVCGLDILFLRHEEPGALVTQGGDIDGRIKTLLDALRMPKPGNEVVGIAPDADENPFFCLLEQDTLITDLRVTTDRLLTEAGAGHAKQDVMLIIQVTVRRTMAMWENLPLL
jgi:hypothetical protein